MVGTEDDVDPGRKVGEVVPGAFDLRMMPMVQLGCAEQHAERPEPKAHVRVHEHRPDGSEGDEPSDRTKFEAHREPRQVGGQLRGDAVEGMLAVSGQKIEVLGAVMHCMEAPERLEGVACAVEPIDENVAEHDGKSRAQPPRAGADPRTKRERLVRANRRFSPDEERQCDAVPK